MGEVIMVRRATFGLVAGIGVVASGFGLTGTGKLSLRPHPKVVQSLNTRYQAPSFPSTLAFPDGPPIGCPVSPVVPAVSSSRPGLPISRVARLRVLGLCD